MSKQLKKTYSLRTQQKARFRSNRNNKTNIKFKPFSDDCTLDQIQSQMRTIRLPVHSKTSLFSGPKTLSFMEKIDKIVNKLSNKKTSKRSKTTFEPNEDYDEIRVTNTAEKQIKVIRKKMHRKMQSLVSTEGQEFYLEGHLKSTTADIRQIATCKEVCAENGTINPFGKSSGSSLLLDFNKNNCYLFSRSKQKVMAEQVIEPIKQAKWHPKEGNYLNFGNIYYKSYLKKYVDRKNLLSKKVSLIRMVSN